MILAINAELKNNGIATVIYEHGQPTNIEFLYNLLGSYVETAVQVEADMNTEDLLEEDE